VRSFKTKWFTRFARRQKIADQQLLEAVLRAELGIVDADLGAGLIKQRIPRSGAGRSGGYRTIVAYRQKDRAVFVYGFAKSQRDNIEPSDLERLRDAGQDLLCFTNTEIDLALAQGELQEIDNAKNRKN
jgi:hypothetical protein